MVLTLVQAKVKFTLEQTTKAQRGSGDTAMLFFLISLLYTGVGGQRQAPAALPPGNTR
jgi:hypothetical protein